MDVMQISKKDFSSFIDVLIKKGNPEIIGVIRKESRYSFDVLETASALTLDYDETILPPKKYLLPQREVLLSFKPKDATSYKPVFDVTQRIIIGVHPGDLTAISLLDKTMSTGQQDTNYLKRRENITLIGIYPTTSYKYRFTDSMINEKDPYNAADLMLIDMGDSTYAIEVVTPKGKALISRSSAKNSTLSAQAIESKKHSIKDEVTLSLKRADLPAFLNGKERDKVFEGRAKKCFACGSCTMVCPTCFCFDVNDEVALSLQSGERVRSWDGCVIENFATVAGNHNFRKNTADRMRHRLFRKGKYLQEKYGITGCVGCGRCVHACTADVASPAEIINEMNGGGQ